jgi:hypothetical protein
MEVITFLGNVASYTDYTALYPEDFSILNYRYGNLKSHTA